MLNFLRNTLYIRLSPECLSVLQVESQYLISDLPLVAIEEKKGKKVILAYGQEALAMPNLPGISKINGFKHPRTIIADFGIAEQTMRYFIKQAQKHRKFPSSPIAIIHPIDELEGGFTQIEVRALAELCSMAGASSVYVWQGQELSIQQMERLNFPLNAGKLLFPDK